MLTRKILTAVCILALCLISVRLHAEEPQVTPLDGTLVEQLPTADNAAALAALENIAVETPAAEPGPAAKPEKKKAKRARQKQKKVAQTETVVQPAAEEKDEAQSEEARQEILASPEMHEAMGWTEATLAIRAGDGPEMVKQWRQQVAGMSAQELEDLLMQYRYARMTVQQEEHEFLQMRSQTFDKAFAYHLEMQRQAMQMAANRKAATFKEFDSGQDRYNNGFHGYRGPPSPLIRGGFFFRAR